MCFLKLISDPCSDPSILKIIYFVKEIIKIFLTVVPIGAMIMLTYDLFKNVISGNESEQRKNFNIFMRRIIMLVIVVLFPSLIKFFVSFINEYVDDNNNISICISVDKDMIDRQLKVYKDNCIKEKGTWDSNNETCSVSVYIPKATINNKKDAKKSSKSSTSSNDMTNDFTIKGNKKYYYVNGKKTTGEKKINGYYYYFNKNGVMQTGWKTVNGVKKYYNNDGKRASGKVKIGKDTFWFKESNGKVEGVSLGVKRIQQSGANCGPTSLNMVMSYYTNKSYNEKSFALKYGHGDTGFKRAANDFGYKRIYFSPESMTKDKMKSILVKRYPIIMSVPAFKDGARGRLATMLRYTGGSGHFLVISGIYKNTVIIKDPAGRKSSVPYKEVESVVNGFNYFKKN